MNIYFDTEFTGLHKNTTIVSIGLVSHNGKMFYAESTDFDDSQCDEWIMKNVLSHTIMSGNDELAKCLGEDNNITVVIGDRESISSELRQWLSQFDDVQFVSDVCHYDMVLLIDIFGTAFDLPENVSASCHDINQDIAKHCGISEKDAFNECREDIVSGNGISIDGKKHNALYDAKVIKAIYEITHR